MRAALGGTVNDVVLAAITGGFRRLILSRGESVERVVRTLVPVSVRSATEHGMYNNRVSAMFADLPVEIEDPADGSARSRRRWPTSRTPTRRWPARCSPRSAVSPRRCCSRWPSASQRGSRSSNVNTVTTNVPGPQHPLYACGRRMLESFPYVPLGGHVRVGVAIFSYDGALHVRGHRGLRLDAGHRGPLRGNRSLRPGSSSGAPARALPRAGPASERVAGILALRGAAS